MIRIIGTAVWLVFALQNYAFAETDMSKIESTRHLADSAMALIAKENIESALRTLRPHWPVSDKSLATLIENTSKARKQMGDFGKNLGFHHVSSRRLVNKLVDKSDDTLVMHTYLVKYELHYVIWQLIFYKPATTWQMNSIRWQDNAFDLLEE